MQSSQPAGVTRYRSPVSGQGACWRDYRAASRSATRPPDVRGVETFARPQGSEERGEVWRRLALGTE